MRNTQPAFPQGQLAQTDVTLGETTTYSITYTTLNPMPANPSLLLEYPPTVGIATTLSTCTITISAVVYNMYCPVNNNQRKIKIQSDPQPGTLLTGITVPVPEGAQVVIAFGPVTNPTTPQSVASFKLTSYTDSNQIYMIDRVANNLVPQYQCQYPCATCPSQTQRSACLTCFTTEPQKYLSGTNCVTACPQGTAPNDLFVCAGPTIDFTASLQAVSSY